jgi:hypothetical protein
MLLCRRGFIQTAASPSSRVAIAADANAPIDFFCAQTAQGGSTLVMEAD